MDESCALNVRVACVVPVGMPLITPVVGFRERLLSGRGGLTDQLTGSIPPELSKVVLYNTPSVAFGNDTVVISRTPIERF